MSYEVELWRSPSLVQADYSWGGMKWLKFMRLHISSNCISYVWRCGDGDYGISTKPRFGQYTVCGGAGDFYIVDGDGSVIWEQRTAKTVLVSGTFGAGAAAAAIVSPLETGIMPTMPTPQIVPIPTITNIMPTVDQDQVIIEPQTTEILTIITETLEDGKETLVKTVEGIPATVKEAIGYLDKGKILICGIIIIIGILFLGIILRRV